MVRQARASQGSATAKLEFVQQAAVDSAVVPIGFGDYVLDVDGRELTRRGERVALSPKAFELLAILVTHRPKALSKSALQDHLWPKTFVVEKNLANLVAEIRNRAPR
jgi:DNA-binding winged helix-turn-helix (wHTH) protein